MPKSSQRKKTKKRNRAKRRHLDTVLTTSKARLQQKLNETLNAVKAHQAKIRDEKIKALQDKDSTNNNTVDMLKATIAIEHDD